MDTTSENYIKNLKYNYLHDLLFSLDVFFVLPFVFS